MVQKQITICGKDIVLAYCYATEISFKLLAEEEIHAFLQQATKAVEAKTMPDIRKCIFLILAAAQAYYESKGEEMPIEDKDIMYNCSPEDIGTAIGTIIRLYAEFYHLPMGEAQEASQTKKGNKGKN